MYYRFFFITLIVLSAGCSDSREQTTKQAAAKPAAATKAVAQPAATSAAPVATADATRPEIPILCYHQIRDWTDKDTKGQRVYIVPVATYKEQIRLLKENGYNTILPDELMAYLQKGAKLPPNPIMLTYDDADETQYTNGLPELDKAGYKGVFFVMTVVLNHPKYFTRDEVKQLADKGHAIASHTWDHHSVTKYTGKDWDLQIGKPKATLEKIVGKPIVYFAYPNGLWNPAAVAQLKQYGFTAAFQLATHIDKDEPMYTIRRVIADPYWSGDKFLKALKKDFSGASQPTATTTTTKTK